MKETIKHEAVASLKYLGTTLGVLVVTAIVKGEPLTGLARFSGIVRLLQTSVPLWVLLILLLLAVPGWVCVIGHRTQRELHVVWEPENCGWGRGAIGAEPAMQIVAQGVFTATGPNALQITRAYFKGTRCRMGPVGSLIVPAHHTVHGDLMFFVQPVVGTQGSVFRGRLILVDQYNRHHKTEAIDFRCFE